MAGSRTKNPVESRHGCIPLRPVVATSRPGEHRGGRIPYKKKRSVPWLPDPVQKNPLKSRGNLISRDLVSGSKTGPGHGPGNFYLGTLTGTYEERRITLRFSFCGHRLTTPVVLPKQSYNT